MRRVGALTEGPNPTINSQQQPTNSNKAFWLKYFPNETITKEGLLQLIEDSNKYNWLDDTFAKIIFAPRNWGWRK